MVEIGIILYGIIGLLSIRPMAGHLAYSWLDNAKVRYSILYGNQPNPTGEQWFGAYLTAIAAAFVWPLVIAFIIQGNAIQIGKESEYKRAELSKRVKELERSLEIGD